MDVIGIITTAGSAISIIVGYFKIMSVIAKREQEKEKEIKEYVDKEIEHVAREIEHIKESYINEIKNLEKKIDMLREDFKENQKILLDLFRTKK